MTNAIQTYIDSRPAEREMVANNGNPLEVLHRAVDDATQEAQRRRTRARSLREEAAALEIIADAYEARALGITALLTTESTPTPGG